MLNPIKSTDFDAIKLKLASAEEMLSWSNGEVTRPETINYRTQKAEKDGLFCEKIFGPSKDWECYCGKYKKIRYKGIVCDKCGVEVTRSIVRRERFGHITLETPCSHIWFLRGIASKIGLLLNLSMQSLEKVVYFANFIVTDVNEDLKVATIDQIKNELKEKKKFITDDYNNQVKEIKNKKGKMMNEGMSAGEVDNALAKEIDVLVLTRDEKMENLTKYFAESLKELKDLKPILVISEETYQKLSLKYGHIFEAGIGAEAISKILKRINLDETIKNLEKESGSAIDSKQEKLTKRLKLLKSLNANDIRPEWMILTVVPVIPPDLRPMVSLEGGRFATSDLNDLYRRVINRNNRLKQLMELNAPEVICRNEKRMLQEAVDALIDNSARASKTTVASTGQKRQLKSLADSLKGKQGRFRQNLLGKRTDYSGRSVIVVNPKLNLDQCGLPKRMALELFKPFIISKLIKSEVVHNVRSASRYIEAGTDDVWDILEEIVNKSFVLLNRAPTLHRLGIQAFRPILIEGKAIQIHPLVCTAFNADFDGDQMAVHVPLTEEAKWEAEHLMLSSHNLLKPATGDPIVTPNQDIVWGAYYITFTNEIAEEKDDKTLKHFSDELEMKIAYENGAIGLQNFAMVRIREGQIIKTTVGRILFNEILPDQIRFVNNVIRKSDLKQIVKQCLAFYGDEATVKFVDSLKNRAFQLITKAGLSFGMSDLPFFPEVDVKIEIGEKKVAEILNQYEEGLLTESERVGQVIELWSKTKEDIIAICKNNLTPASSVYSMIDSGARGSWAQLTQILGMKGSVTSPSGGIIELPIKRNFKKGFDVLEYFIATHGTRKGLSDTALRTANAGYLTRRLVDVSQDVIISEDDCGDTEGVTITHAESEEIGESILKRITGRYLAKDLLNKSGKVLLKKSDLMTEILAEELKGEEIEEASIRSVMSCRLGRGICAKCYGYDLARNKQVEIGVPVGIIAAQSIGEPGTQLTMRTFHTGGVAGSSDITQGLPRVEEIFENRTPKKKAIMSDVDGKVKIETTDRVIHNGEGQEMTVANQRLKILKVFFRGEESEKYRLPAAEDAEGNKIEVKFSVKNGEEVSVDQELFSVGKKVVSAKESGRVEIGQKVIKISRQSEKVEEMVIPKGTTLLVKDGEEVKVGQQLTDGSLDLDQLYRLGGQLAVQKYIIKEIQYVYSSQGQPLNDKHVEIIARQMFSRFLVISAGESDLLPGEIVEGSVLARLDEDVRKTVKAERLLSGITRTSLTTESFLSAASFQETARVLIDAALSGKIDYLEGLKENVIIGCLIPAGTGYKGKKKRAIY
ncbi:MAG: DNA-directed RNA polymerase subunit beta' [Patescibacteria group bacterium]|jgi:DNA-directed RNA polymerase subunit beta'